MKHIKKLLSRVIVIAILVTVLSTVAYGFAYTVNKNSSICSGELMNKGSNTTYAALTITGGVAMGYNSVIANVARYDAQQYRTYGYEIKSNCSALHMNYSSTIDNNYIGKNFSTYAILTPTSYSTTVVLKGYLASV